MTTRSMQNAADAAAIAAATNGGSNYDAEARAVAAAYGFIDGANTVSVTVSNAAAYSNFGYGLFSLTFAVGDSQDSGIFLTCMLSGRYSIQWIRWLCFSSYWEQAWSPCFLFMS